MGVFSMIDYRWIAQYSRPALLVATGLLVLVQLFGITSGGAERALQVGFLMFQPAEFAKVALLTYLAVLLAKKQEYIQSFSRAFTPLFAWIILVVVLIGIEDLSTASLVLMSAVLMCFVARVHVAQLASLAMLTVTLAIIFLLVSPARMNRVEEYLGVKLTEQTEEAEAVPVELLGDLILCSPVIAAEAADQQKLKNHHWAHMIIHGVLHLCGYDHVESAQALEMENLERRALADLGFPDPYQNE